MINPECGPYLEATVTLEAALAALRNDGEGAGLDIGAPGQVGGASGCCLLTTSAWSILTYDSKKMRGSLKVRLMMWREH